jgi:hypothetical protein
MQIMKTFVTSGFAYNCVGMERSSLTSDCYCESELSDLELK